MARRDELRAALVEVSNASNDKEKQAALSRALTLGANTALEMSKDVREHFVSGYDEQVNRAAGR